MSWIRWRGSAPSGRTETCRPDPDRMTPVEALMALSELKRAAAG